MSEMTNDDLETMPIIDIIRYSTRTEKCRNEVIEMTAERKLKLKISMTDIYSIQIYESFPAFSMNSVMIFIEQINAKAVYNSTTFNGKLVPTTLTVCPTHLKTHWRNIIEGLIFMLDYLMELFPNSEICCLHIGEESGNNKRTVIEWMKNKGLSDVEFCQILDEINAEDSSYILENVNITSGMEVNTELPDNFECTLPRNLEHFECEYSKWIKREQLLNMNFKYFYIIRTQFRNEDVSEFIGKWLIGGLSELRFCILHAPFYDLDEIVSGIKYKKTVSTLQCTVKPSKYSKDEHEMNGVYDYLRKDGKIITIGTSSHYLLGKLIQLYVWSK
ncbi:unnamed protein product [Caenorhabditis brenneri]